MDNNLVELSKYRMEQAKQCLRSAKLLADSGDFRGSANRSYYAIFQAMRSVLALEQKDFSKHSGVSAYFRKAYIKTNIFDPELSDIISEAFEVRNDSDYDDFYVISVGEVQDQISNAEKFITDIGVVLEQQYEK